MGNFDASFDVLGYVLGSDTSKSGPQSEDEKSETKKKEPTAAVEKKEGDIDQATTREFVDGGGILNKLTFRSPRNFETVSSSGSVGLAPVGERGLKLVEMFPP